MHCMSNCARIFCEILGYFPPKIVWLLQNFKIPACIVVFDPTARSLNKKFGRSYLDQTTVSGDLSTYNTKCVYRLDLILALNVSL